MNNKVSLMTPVYNAMPYFAGYLSSVLSQTYRPLEFVCVDDGSTDGSYEYLISKIPDFEAAGIELRTFTVAHAGQSAAINHALRNVTGKYLTWCDADDELDPESIEIKALWLDENPDYSIARSDGYMVREKEQCRYRIAGEYDRTHGDLFDAVFRDESYCYAGAYMLRTDALTACFSGDLPPVSPEGQNLQLLLPLLSRGSCGFIDKPLFTYHLRENGHSCRKRSYSECISRIGNFTRLRKELLQYCECDREYYGKEADRLAEKYRAELLRSTVRTINGRSNYVQTE